MKSNLGLKIKAVLIFLLRSLRRAWMRMVFPTPTSPLTRIKPFFSLIPDIMAVRAL